MYSVDKFGDCDAGGSMGPIGPPGPQGKRGRDGLDISKFLPTFTLDQFQKDEERTCLLITDPTKDLSGQYRRWYSRSVEKNDAISVNPSTSCKKIKDGLWALNFPALYEIDLVTLSSQDCIFICITFQIDQNKKDEQFVFNDFDQESVSGSRRGMSVLVNTIRIYGVDNEYNYIEPTFIIPKESWTTILVEYLSEKEKRKGSYVIINGKDEIRGTFTCNKAPPDVLDVTFIGALEDNQKPMTGSICAIEIYDKKEKAPDTLKELVMKGQMKAKHSKEEPIPNGNYCGSTEDFRRDQVAFWFCADHWFSIKLIDTTNQEIKEVGNLSMYKSFASKSLNHVGGQIARVNWVTLKGKMIMQENEMYWRTNPKSATDEWMYHRWFEFKKSKYVIDYPLCMQENVCVVLCCVVCCVV